MSDHLQHDAPLVHLVATLHAGTTLRDRVVKLRWRRRRSKQNGLNGEIPVEAIPESRATDSSLVAESNVSAANLGGVDGETVNNNKQGEVMDE